MGKQQYKVIIFDKDGTLFDYTKIWYPIVRKTFSSNSNNKISNKDLDYLMKQMGLPNANSLDAKGLLFKRKNIIKALKVLCFLRKKDLKLYYLKKTYKERHSIIPKIIREELSKIDFAAVQKFLSDLKDLGYIIALVTCDNISNTQAFVDEMKIEKYLDFIATSSSDFSKKPSSDTVNEICNKFNVKPKEIVVVGDSTIDMKFAKNSKVGYAIGVLSGQDNEKLRKYTNIIYKDIINIYDDKNIFYK